MTTALAAPKAAQALIDEAEAAGMTVTRKATPSSFEVFIKAPHGADADAVWEVVNVAPNNSRLGFPTSYKRGVRFGYGTAKTHSGYHHCKSVREVRFHLGLSI